MSNPMDFLLRDARQAEAFRSEFRSFALAREAEYAAWIGSLPPCVWVRHLDGVPEDKWRLVVGMECLAYLDGLVNVTFSEDGLMIRRDPRDEDEFWTWAERKTKPPR